MGMSPLTTMIISGIVTAVASVTALVSGAYFKRALDAYQAQSHSTTASSSGASNEAQAVGSKGAVPRSQVGVVKSVGQKGGITAGYVESVKQAPPKK